MAVKDRTTKVANINANEREIDFVSRFSVNMSGLMELLGVMAPIKKTPGVAIKAKRGHVVLQNGNVPEGDEIPYSAASVEEIPVGEIVLEKYAKGTTIEAIEKYGFDVAIGKTDDAFLYELQKGIEHKLYTFLNGGELTARYTTYQMAIAMANGLARDSFKAMGLGATGVVGFINMLDFYAYLGAANITVQNQFGLDYVQNFMGYNVLFLLPGNDIPSGRVIATVVENLNVVYADPADGDFAKAGLEFVTDGLTNFIGFHTEGRYSHAVSECYALMGIVGYAEYLDGIAVVDVETSGSLGSLTVSSVAGTATGETKLSIAEEMAQGGKLFYKAASGTAPSAPSYLAALDATWAPFVAGEDLVITNGYKVTVVETNGAGQALASGNATVVAHG